MRSYTSYPVSSYAGMLTDADRMAAYTSALKRLIGPETTVLDIGCGTGFFAVYAAKLGARQVVGIDDNESVEVARKVAAANGVEDRVEFLTGLSTETDFGRRFDVIVSDLRGVVPLFGHHIASLIDAKDRLLAAGGTLLPEQDRIMVALAEAEQGNKERAVARRLLRDHGVDMTAADRGEPASPWGDRLDGGELRSEPVEWARIEYGKPISANVRNDVELLAPEACRLDGIAMWFDAVIYDHLGFSNRPPRPDSTYGCAMLHLEQPIDLPEGARVGLDLEARLAGDDYIWRWVVEATAESGAPLGRGRNSTAFSDIGSLEALARRSEHFVPELTHDGEVAREVLGALDGSTDLGAVARLLVQRFPGRWESWESALAVVADVAELHAG